MALYGWGKVGVRVEDRYVRVYYPTFPHHLPETLLTRCRGGCPHPPSRRQARNIGEDGWFVQPTFSQTATQGRAGTPAPTTWSGRVRNICVPPSVYVSSPTICCEVVNIILTFSSVPRKGRRGRRPLRLGCKRTFQQPYDAAASGSPRGVEDAAPYGAVFDLFRPHAPPGSIRTRGRKRRKSLIRGGGSIRPGGRKRRKSLKRVARGLLRLFRLFRTGSVFTPYPYVEQSRPA